MTDEVRRIAAFERTLQGRLATRVEPSRFGAAYLNERFPRRCHSNFLWVDRPPKRMPTEELDADAGDWPMELYAKLGFDRVARSVDFVRKPGQRA